MVKNLNMDYVLIAGYGWSGSSAVVDLLKEFNGFWDPNIEFRLIKDSYGLIDLRYNLVEKWDPLNSDIAIKDFVWLTNHLNHKNSKISLQQGLDYQNIFKDNFLIQTNNFLEHIIKYNYKSHWWFFDFKKTKLEYFIYKILRKVNKNKSNNSIMHFSNCTEEEFDKWSKLYINSLFSPIIKENNMQHIILDQAVPVQNPEMAQHYFDNYKIIIVDRDPRDIYVDLINGKFLLGQDLAVTHDVFKYIDWHKAMRKNLNNILKLSNIKYIRFEDLIINYDKSINEIVTFLNISPNEHIHKCELFKPNISKRNIGLWKNYSQQNEIAIIEKELSEYIYDA